MIQNESNVMQSVYF